MPVKAPAASPAAADRFALHVADLLLPIAVALWAVGISRTNIAALSWYGLPPVLPVVYYLGIGLLVVSAITELVGRQLTQWRMALHTAVLTVMLYGTAPLVYAAGRYSWLYKTIGVVQYVNAHGQLDRSIDIYQNWPGFFALAAWFDKVAGVSSPLAYAKWSQLAFELAALPLLYLIYDAIKLTRRQRWLALLIFPASNWIGQDYFSPQALGTVLCLGIMAIVMRWMFIAQPGARRRWRDRRRRDKPAALPPGRPAKPPEPSPGWNSSRSATQAEATQPAGSDIASLINSHLGRPGDSGSAASPGWDAQRPGATRETGPAVPPPIIWPEPPPEQAMKGWSGQREQPGQDAGTGSAGDSRSASGNRAAIDGGVAAGASDASANREAADRAAAADRRVAGERATAGAGAPSRSLQLGYVAAIALLFFVLSFTHELSPYMLVAQVAALAVFRMLRPRWLPVLLGAIAVGYLVPRFGYVNSHYGLLQSIGNLFNNATPPALTGGSVAPSQRLIERSAELLSVGIWCAALLGAWLRRRSGRIILALLLLAFSPAAMLALQAYGHEGVLRVYLFSLPWSAALVAMAISPPSPRERASLESGRADAGSSGARWLSGLTRPVTAMVRSVKALLRPVARLLRPVTWLLGRDAVRALVVLTVCLTLFFPAFFGDDSFNYMSQAEVDIVTSFLRTAPVGRLYIPIDNAPLADTSKYELFPKSQIIGDMIPNGLLKPNIATLIAQNEHERSGLKVPAYVVITPSMVEYNKQYELTPPRNFAVLRTSLADSKQWKLLTDQDGVIIYELVPRAR